MNFIKIGESVNITQDSICSYDEIASTGIDFSILNSFSKTAATLKRVAPKANDFLYFSAIMMHAAEAALIDESGLIKKDANGKEITAQWERVGENGEGCRWVCSDPNIKPFKNANLDSFPEKELISAHKKWIGKPLCLDHKSSSPEMVRGIIVDTVYDQKFKRVIALCAVDKINNPKLARDIQTGVCASVSMGTGVEKAICFDCGKVAKSETDFCLHMKPPKTTYCEINEGLNPIELSIVVNGADPKAKIKTIIASTQNIAESLSQETTYDTLNKLNFIRKDLIELQSNLEKDSSYKSDLEQVTQTLNNLALTLEASQVKNADTSSGSVKNNYLVEKLSSTLHSLQEQLTRLETRVEDLQNMTQKTAYFQGGGGVNEPALGQVKYPKEPLAEQVRDTQDKQMLQTGDMGTPENLFPGDLEKKKMLQRAAEERALKRKMALDRISKNLKQGYWQGGGDVNEPTPGKPKYPKDPLAEKVRDKEDKQMVGAPPFPNVGPVDGLYPKDLEKKKMLQRADLKARFVKAANPDGSENFGDSQWQVFANNHMIFSASVNELTSNRADSLYDVIATKDFGKKMLKRFQTEDFEKVASSYKVSKLAQAVPLGAPPSPSGSAAVAAGAVPGEMQPMPEMGMPEEVVDRGGTGDPKEQVRDLLDQAERIQAELRRGVETLLEGGDELDQLKPQTKEEEMMSPLPPNVAKLITMKENLGKALLIGFKKADSGMKNTVAELRKASQICRKAHMLPQSERKNLNLVLAQVCSDAKKSVDNAHTLMRTFINYASGTESILKQSDKIQKMRKLAQRKPEKAKLMDMPKELTPKFPGDPATTELYSPGIEQEKIVLPSTSKPKPIKRPIIKSPTTGPASLPKDYPGRSGGLVEETLKGMTPEPSGIPASRTPSSPRGGAIELEDFYADDSCADDSDLKTFLDEEAKEPEHEGLSPERVIEDIKELCEKYEVDEKSEDEDENELIKIKQDGSMEASSPEEAGKAMKSMKGASKKDLAMWRKSLAEKVHGGDLLNQAHPGSGPTLANLSTKPSGDLGKIETLDEIQKRVQEVVNMPPKIKNAVENIQKLIMAGSITPADFPDLLKKGVDPEAIKYWKAFYGQAKDGGSQFATDLLKEHKSAKAGKDLEVERVRIKRAYELAHNMASKGLIVNSQASINTQVDKLLTFNDEAFANVQNITNTMQIKTASSGNGLGAIGTEDHCGGLISQANDILTQSGPEDFKSQLEVAFNSPVKMWRG